LISGGAPSTLDTSTANSTLSTAEIFDPGDDPVNGTWTLTSPMNNGRCYHTSTLLLLPTGPVLVAGGFASAGEGGAFGLPLSSAEVFDPTTGAWSIISSMNNAHAAHTATLLSSNVVGQFEVLVAGGACSVFEFSTFAELYEPPPVPATGGVVVGGSWKPVGPMNVGRAWHNATALPPLSDFSRLIQQVLVTGGGGAAGDVFTLAGEIYDSATGSWTLTGNATADRTTAIAALLADGTVLLAGGFNADVGGFANSAEIGTGCDANALIVVSPQQTMNYGQVPAGTEAVPPDFAPTVENTGNAELTLTATISGPDAALFLLPPKWTSRRRKLSAHQPIRNRSIYIRAHRRQRGAAKHSTAVEPTFSALSPVPKTCQATLTLGGSNAANVSAGQTWTFPLIAQIVPSEPGLVITIDKPSFPLEGGPVTEKVAYRLGIPAQ
jgi:hypothetical protein